MESEDTVPSAALAGVEQEAAGVQRVTIGAVGIRMLIRTPVQEAVTTATAAMQAQRPATVTMSAKKILKEFVKIIKEFNGEQEGRNGRSRCGWRRKWTR